MGPERREREQSTVLVGTTADALDRAAGHLVDLASVSPDGLAVDLSSWLLVVPGSRAGRLALRALVKAAERIGRPLDPPEVATSGTLVERLLAPLPGAPAVATPLERRLGWARALSAAPRDRTAPLVARGPQPDAEAWWRVAAHAVRLEDELHGAGRSFEHLAIATEQLGGDASRARAFASVEPDAMRELAAVGLTTPHADRAARATAAAPRVPNVALLGALELGAPQREALARASRVLALVIADPERREHFDDLGCVLPTWGHVRAKLDEEWIVSAESPADEAEAALEFVADAMAAAGGRAADEIVIGVGDESLGPTLALRARDAGLEVHDAAGVPLPATSVGRALGLLHEWVRSRRASALAALLRHPAAERYVRERPGVTRDPLVALDRVRSRRLPSVFDLSASLDAEAEPGQGGGDLATVRAVVRALDERFGGATDARSIATAIADLKWDEDDRPGLAVVLDALEELSSIDGTLLEGHDVFALLVEEAARLRVPTEPRERSVEALGWLELLFEPAGTVAVVGMNEGRVPSAPPSDPLLTESVREALGLPSRASRAARDAAILDVVVRRSERVRFICGRMSDDGDPLEPSRFLLHEDGSALAARVERLFDANRALADRRAWRRPNAAQSGFRVPQPPSEAAEIRSMRVTGFRDYLESPIRFWLRHIEELEEVVDDERELSPPDLGTLVHELLRASAADGALGRSDADSLAKELCARLDALARDRFGARPAPAVRLQLLAFRPRLLGFARWQAEATAAGWGVRHVEIALPDDTSVAPAPGPGGSGHPMQVRGRVDRIDWHAGTRRWRIIDVKTSDKGDGPRETHLRGGAGPSRWRDLQLPLYWHGMREVLVHEEPGSAVELGYVVLPADASRCGWADAAFSADELDDALRVASDVVARIRRGEFPEGGRPAWHDPFATVLQRPVFARDPDDDEDGAP